MLAGINCWNDKYYWDFWRPWQAIHEADRDGNRATEPDGSWTALLTAPYPEHPSGHLCLDGASLGVLRMFFDTDKVRFGVTSARFPGEIRSFDRFSDALDEIIEARIWAGLHYRTADVQARNLGRKVARYMAKHTSSRSTTDAWWQGAALGGPLRPAPRYRLARVWPARPSDRCSRRRSYGREDRQAKPSGWANAKLSTDGAHHRNGRERQHDEEPRGQIPT